MNVTGTTSVTALASAAADKIITGAPKIAKYLRVSRITVLRMIDGKRLAAFKTGGNSSPWKCWLSEIKRVRRGGVGQHLEAAE